MQVAAFFILFHLVPLMDYNFVKIVRLNASHFNTVPACDGQNVQNSVMLSIAVLCQHAIKTSHWIRATCEKLFSSH